MHINKVHCFFEQSGTFKNAFKHYGIDAADYDILNNFGETDNVIDLFIEIEKAYCYKSSIFDYIDKQDIIFAFFPCIYFCDYKTLLFRCQSFFHLKYTLEDSMNYNIQEAEKRLRFYTLLLKLVAVVDRLGLRMIIENPWSKNFSGYLQNYFLPPSIIDYNRRSRGDSFIKPTAYWFFGFKPLRYKTYQRSKELKIIDRTHSKVDRSIISYDYALNFISDFILGSCRKGLFQQLDLFSVDNNNDL